jgi:hypothetical protein
MQKEPNRNNTDTIRRNHRQTLFSKYTNTKKFDTKYIHFIQSYFTDHIYIVFIDPGTSVPGSKLSSFPSLQNILI